jgi:hypothetical protein
VNPLDNVNLVGWTAQLHHPDRLAEQVAAEAKERAELEARRADRKRPPRANAKTSTTRKRAAE